MGRTKRKRPGPATEPAAGAAVPASVASVLGNDVLLAEILLRLDLPTWLVRAALACRRWLCRASDPAFLRRFRALQPPRVLALRASAVGFSRETRCLPMPQPPGLAAAGRLALATLRRSDLCDRRNGRLLVSIRDPDPTMPTTYAVRSLLNAARGDDPIPQPPRSNPRLLRSSNGTCDCSSLWLLEDDADSTSCLSLNLCYNYEEFAADFSLLQSGVWGVTKSSVTQLPQRMIDTIVADRLLVGRKFYMTTTLGYILGLDLTTASFFTVQLPGDMRNSTSFRLSRPQQSGLYLIGAKGFLLHVWHGDGMGQWVLVDTISVPEVCGHLNVRRWLPDDVKSAPVSVLEAGENSEFVFLELVASGIVCCIQLSNRAVETREGVFEEDRRCHPPCYNGLATSLPCA
ncbi:unnamed protein product [Urochloa humidicola]